MTFIHLRTPRPPRSILSPARITPQAPSCTPEQCPILRNSPGPMIPVLRRFQTPCMLRRRPLSPEWPSLRFSMVRSRDPLHARLSMLNLLIHPILGILTALFFQCMTALFNPVNRRRQGTRWWLISYTIIMFLVATAFTGMTLHVGSISYIDNRKFTGVKDVFPPGPLGYQSFIRSTAFIIADFLPLLNYWLADGLLVSSLFDSSPALLDA